MSGIEHPQADWLLLAFRGSATAPDVSLVEPRLSALSLSRRDSATRGGVLGQLAAGPTPEGLGRIAGVIAGFGIGEHQEQALAWRALVADLRKAAE